MCRYNDFYFVEKHWRAYPKSTKQWGRSPPGKIIEAALKVIKQN